MGGQVKLAILSGGLALSLALLAHEQHARAREELARERAVYAQWAVVLAACANGSSFTIGGRLVRCKVVYKKGEQ